jgi:hypothetical protein
VTDGPADSAGVPPPDDASFSGQLSQTPLFVVLRRIQRERFSGTLSVLRDDQVRQLFFEEGELRAARSSREDHRIGATLVRWGYISEKDLAHTLETQRQTRQRIDQILVEKGFVTRAVVDGEARRQMEQIIFSTLAWPDGAFHFEPDTGAGELDVTISFSEDVIIEGIRRIPESEQFVELLGDLRSVPRLTKDPMNTVALRVLKDAVDVLQRINGERSFEELLESTSSPESATAKILYSMMFAGLVEASPPPDDPALQALELPPSPLPRPSHDDTQPVERSKPRKTGALRLDLDNRQIVLETHRQLDWLSHYDLLGAPRKATQAEIDRAFEARSSLFDPSSKANPELADLWRQLAVLQRWLRVAYGVLSDPVKRAAYDKKIDEAAPAPDLDATHPI